MQRILLLIFMAWSAAQAQQYTLGVGVYPGDPRENFAPVSRVDRAYRNLALHRPVYQSSSYDYNLTGQLVTDGIKDTKLPRWAVVSSSEQGELKKNEREWLLDHNWLTGVNLKGTGGWVQVELAGGEGPREVDRVDIDARVRVGQASGLSAGWTAVVIWHVAAILAVAFLLAAAPAGVLYGAGGLMLALFGVTGSGMLFMVGTCFFMGSWSI